MEKMICTSKLVLPLIEMVGLCGDDSHIVGADEQSLQAMGWSRRRSCSMWWGSNSFLSVSNLNSEECRPPEINSNIIICSPNIFQGLAWMRMGWGLTRNRWRSWRGRSTRFSISDDHWNNFITIIIIIVIIIRTRSQLTSRALLSPLSSLSSRSTTDC